MDYNDVWEQLTLVPHGSDSIIGSHVTDELCEVHVLDLIREPPWQVLEHAPQADQDGAQEHPKH